jgi:16S rRNA (guanine1516-N2)-methyltransferase
MLQGIVTTSYKPGAALAAQAIDVSGRLGVAYVARGNASIAKLRQRYAAKSIVVISAKGIEWYGEDGAEPFFFHPGMSLVRAKRLAEGGRDAMLEAAAFVPGDSVVDCTAGLCSDSIVFSFVGGPATRVTALESEFPLYFIVSNGLQTYASDWDAFASAMRRVEVLHRDHTEYLRALPDRSVDVVYFDPMFRAPELASSGLSPLRALANAGTLTEDAVVEARRVARKSIVLKERGRALEWERFGFDIVSKPNASVAYGVIRL